MDSQPQSVTDAGTLFGDLIQLIDELRLAGFNVGIEQYVTVQNLLLKLAGDRSLPTQPGDLKNLLAPILC